MNSFFTFTTLLVLLASPAFLLANAAPVALENYTFEQYLQDYSLSYPSKTEFDHRKSLFEAEKARIMQVNTANPSWKEGLNQFSVMTMEEKKKMTMGRLKINKGKVYGSDPTKKVLPAQQELNFQVDPVSALPKSVDWRTKGVVSTVKDQGHCGSCWAFASTATMESHIAITTGLLFELSVQQVAMCSPNPDQCGGVGGCGGSTAELAFNYISTASKGLYEEYQYPYVSYYGSDYACKVPGVTAPVATINGFVKLPDNNYTTLMNAVAKVGPIAINVDASTWHSYSSGIFNGCNQGTPDVNHVVVLVGYGEEANGDKYWIVRNSWNAKWGEQGYIRLARFDNDEERCGSDVTPQDGVECAGSDEPVKVCGTCGAIYDSSYPINAKAF